MPLVRRKKVLLHDVPEVITTEPAQSTREVYYIHQTGEIFTDYDSYSARMTFYSMKVFQCELTGKGGLDFFQALDSERTEAMTLHARFPAQLKPHVLAAVQWRTHTPLRNQISPHIFLTFLFQKSWADLTT
jgi:hypothetical protein